MSKYLLKVDETYRVDTEAEVTALIKEAKTNHIYELLKYTSQKKEVKQKGEVVDEYFKVVLTKCFCEEKDPVDQVDISYKICGAFGEGEDNA